MNKYKLEEITTQIYDGKHGDCKNDINSGCYFISVKDINSYEIDYNNARQISKEDFDINYARTKLENGDTIYANTGDTIGKSIYIKNNKLAEKTSFQKSVAVIKPNKEKVEPRYLFYLLQYMTPQLRNAATGSSQKNLLLSTMRDFDVKIHDRNIQIKISNILGKIDDKIINNYHINNNLEELMKTIYQRWFIEFEFPNEEGKPYKSNGGKLVYNDILKREIPKTWKAKKIKDITDVVTGKEDANFSISNGKYKFFTCSQDVLLCDKYKFDGKSVLIAGNGDFNVKHYTGKFNAYQRTYVLIPNDEKFYSQMYICALSKIEAFKKGSNGSIIKFIKKSDVENIDILEPDNNKILEELNKILIAIENNQEENDKLNSLKEFLLPLLMSGQINVDDIEI